MFHFLAYFKTYLSYIKLIRKNNRNVRIISVTQWIHRNIQQHSQKLYYI